MFGIDLRHFPISAIVDLGEGYFYNPNYPEITSCILLTKQSTFVSIMSTREHHQKMMAAMSETQQDLTAVQQENDRLAHDLEQAAAVAQVNVVCLSHCILLTASFPHSGIISAHHCNFIIYYSKFATDHTMFVMEQSLNDSHPETHWKHETPLPGCDCIRGSHTSY